MVCNCRNKTGEWLELKSVIFLAYSFKISYTGKEVRIIPEPIFTSPLGMVSDDIQSVIFCRKIQVVETAYLESILISVVQVRIILSLSIQAIQYTKISYSLESLSHRSHICLCVFDSPRAPVMSPPSSPKSYDPPIDHVSVIRSLAVITVIAVKRAVRSTPMPNAWPRPVMATLEVRKDIYSTL